jgi:hypothetical protein
VTCGDPQDEPWVAWSPDGKWILYTTLDGGGDIFDVEAGTATYVPHVFAGLWAPDSSRFAAETSKGVTFFSPTGTVVATTSVTGAAYLAAYNAAGVYFSTHGDPNELFVISNGQTTAQSVFSLPTKRAILPAEPLQ